MSSPKQTRFFSCYKFNKRVQGVGGPFKQFVTELRLLVKDCDYANSEEMVQDHVDFEINSLEVREKLLNNGSDLTLDKTIDIARSHGMAKAQLKSSNHYTIQRDQALHTVSRQFGNHTMTQQKEMQCNDPCTKTCSHRST